MCEMAGGHYHSWKFLAPLFTKKKYVDAMRFALFYDMLPAVSAMFPRVIVVVVFGYLE